jgi:ribose-phosphate pyrophosphokinase
LIEAHVKLPVLIGPDEESRQWVADIAARIGAPWTVLSKTRTGDESVRETLADAGVLPGRRPVIVDDILSTGRTAIAAANLLRAHFAAEATFLAIHAVFAGDAAALMASSGIRIVTTNSIAHASNEIDIVPLLADEVRPYLSFPEG